MFLDMIYANMAHFKTRWSWESSRMVSNGWMDGWNGHAILTETTVDEKTAAEKAATEEAAAEKELWE